LVTTIEPSDRIVVLIVGPIFGKCSSGDIILDLIEEKLNELGSLRNLFYISLGNGLEVDEMNAHGAWRINPSKVLAKNQSTVAQILGPIFLRTFVPLDD
jgi:hypothetical protein